MITVPPYREENLELNKETGIVGMKNFMRQNSMSSRYEDDLAAILKFKLIIFVVSDGLRCVWVKYIE